MHFWKNLQSGSVTTGYAAIDPTLRVFRGAALDAQKSRIPQMAAALSYRTIFGLLPIVAIGLWILHRVASPDDLSNLVHRLIDFLGLSSIEVNQSIAERATHETESWFVGPPRPEIAPAPVQQAAVTTESLEKWITTLVERINQVPFRTIGIIGIAMLIYAGVSMVAEVERAFNQIYRVPRGRTWARRFTNYWTLLTLAPLGLFATFWMQTQFDKVVVQLTHGRTALGSGALTLNVIGFLTQVAISMTMLLIAYLVVPNTRVRVLPALCGAAAAALMFEASKFGFAKYIEFSASKSYARLYGSLALIPLFLLWVYTSWLIVLFGLQLCYQVHHGRLRTRAQPLMEIGPTLVEPTAPLTVMAALARAFADGRTLDAPTIASHTRLADPIVRLVLGKLLEQALVHRLEGPLGPGTTAAEPSFALARPPQSILMADLLRTGFALAGGNPEDPVVARLHDAQITAAGQESLADAVAESGPLAVSYRDAGGQVVSPPPLPVSRSLLREASPATAGHGSPRGASVPEPGEGPAADSTGPSVRPA